MIPRLARAQIPRKPIRQRTNLQEIPTTVPLLRRTRLKYPGPTPAKDASDEEKEAWLDMKKKIEFQKEDAIRYKLERQAYNREMTKVRIQAMEEHAQWEQEQNAKKEADLITAEKKRRAKVEMIRESIAERNPVVFPKEVRKISDEEQAVRLQKKRDIKEAKRLRAAARSAMIEDEKTKVRRDQVEALAEEAGQWVMDVADLDDAIRVAMSEVVPVFEPYKVALPKHMDADWGSLYHTDKEIAYYKAGGWAELEEDLGLLGGRSSFSKASNGPLGFGRPFSNLE